MWQQKTLLSFKDFVQYLKSKMDFVTKRRIYRQAPIKYLKKSDYTTIETFSIDVQ